MKDLYSISFYNKHVQHTIMNLPDNLQVRFIGLSGRMIKNGPNLGLPHTQAFGKGLFELRLKSVEGIARVFFCLLINKKIVMLHAFTKKSQKTPDKEIRIAKLRMKELANAQ